MLLWQHSQVPTAIVYRRRKRFWSKVDLDRVSQKYGFFQTELNEFKIVAKEVGLKELKDPITGNYTWTRHPLAFLMEAADDICYRIIDLGWIQNW
ncbi:MAG: hypothetical protein IPI88_07290 [Chitinophagaceae bacterium]|nr:hypothetical protein [Chitinophagaceae bacterium]